MWTDSIIQGRLLCAQDLVEIRTLLIEYPAWNRTRLSRELCQRWAWRNEAGQLKDMACRSLLLKLQQRGWIELPARQHASVNGVRNRRPLALAHDHSPVEGPLATLLPLRVEPVAPGTRSGQLFQFRRHLDA